ncbi:MAG TPA: MarC family protein, partial [Shewanella frigidimarina]|nr:MarC family protein [Shewanella frigidimarina]
VFAAEHHQITNYIGMFLTIITLGLVSWGLFRMAPMLFKLLGKTGINVITRLMGLLM